MQNEWIAELSTREKQGIYGIWRASSLSLESIESSCIYTILCSTCFNKIFMTKKILEIKSQFSQTLLKKVDINIFGSSFQENDF